MKKREVQMEDREFLEQENNVEGVRRKLKKDVRKGEE
jgi:hypothetical protein